MTLRSLAIAAARVPALLLGLLPWAFRRLLLRGALVIESRIGGPDAALKRLFALQDDLDLLIAERATAYGHGANPKHRLTGYHDFFVARIPAGARVLDVGCGIAEVARSIAERVPGATVVGIDNDRPRLDLARARGLPANLTLIEGLAPRDLPAGRFDVVVLSNVLEHVDDRVGLLKRLAEACGPARILVRVPLFERDWRLALRRELGVDFRSDPTHCIEHTLAEFEAEVASAGLSVVERQTLWGEIWAELRP
ncbi:MAG: class I SAM-dependent methyltransferase [Actinomycetota bacterium]